MSETKRPVGRPSIYTNELADEICERIASGESLRRICSDEHMPVERTVYLWLNESSEFFHKYTRARERQADCYLDEMIEIADNTQDAGSNVRVQVARLRIDTRKIVIEKLAPKKYGTQRTENTISGSLNIDRPLSDLFENDETES